MSIFLSIWFWIIFGLLFAPLVIFSIITKIRQYRLEIAEIDKMFDVERNASFRPIDSGDLLRRKNEAKKSRPDNSQLISEVAVMMNEIMPEDSNSGEERSTDDGYVSKTL